MTSISDNQGNVYKTAAVQHVFVGNLTDYYFQLYYAANASSTGTTIITAKQTSSGLMSMAVDDFTGLDTTAPLDSVNGLSQSTHFVSFSSVNTGQVTGSQSGELYFAAGSNDLASDVSPTVSGWEGINLITSGGNVSTPVYTEFREGSAITTSETWSLSSLDDGVAGVIAVFRPPQQTSSTLDSTVFDTGATSQLNSLTWQGYGPTGTTVEFQLATSNSSSGPWSYVGPDGLTSSYFIPTAGTAVPLSYSLFGNVRYFRYRAFMQSDTTGSLLPRIDDVSVNWSP
jgi:hypothetical protein